jgi:hypothetical protein
MKISLQINMFNKSIKGHFQLQTIRWDTSKMGLMIISNLSLNITPRLFIQKEAKVRLRSITKKSSQ